MSIILILIIIIIMAFQITKITIIILLRKKYKAYPAGPANPLPLFLPPRPPPPSSHCSHATVILVPHPLHLLPYPTGWCKWCGPPSPAAVDLSVPLSFLQRTCPKQSGFSYLLSLAYLPVCPSENLASQLIYRLCFRGEILPHVHGCISEWRMGSHTT